MKLTSRKKRKPPKKNTATRKEREKMEEPPPPPASRVTFKFESRAIEGNPPPIVSLDPLGEEGIMAIIR